MTRAQDVIGLYQGRKTVVDNDGLAALLPHVSQIKSWCDEISALGLSELAKGNKVGDYKRVEGRSNRSWVDEDKVIKAIKNQGHKSAEIFTKKLIGIGAAEKLLGKGHKIFKRKDLVIKPPGKAVMVAGTDPRSPIELDANDEFSE